MLLPQLALGSGCDIVSTFDHLLLLHLPPSDTCVRLSSHSHVKVTFLALSYLSFVILVAMAYFPTLYGSFHYSHFQCLCYPWVVLVIILIGYWLIGSMIIFALFCTLQTFFLDLLWNSNFHDPVFPDCQYHISKCLLCWVSFSS